MSGESNPNSEQNPGKDKSYFGLIVAGGLVAMLVIWTYIFFGMEGVSIWAQIGVSLVALGVIVAAWRFRRQRAQKQLDVLQQWAEKESATPARPKRH